jgi:CheY-like chemotaxis protein
MEKFKVLFVDDDKRYAQSLVDRAFSEAKLDLEHVDNWEEAISRITENEEFQAIIIDGKGKKTKDGKGDDMSHVTKAIEDIGNIKGQGNYIPYAFLSKYIEVKELIEPERFFEKTKDEKRLFAFLIDQIKSSPIEKLKVKYSAAFSPFSKNIIDKKYQHVLVEMLNCLEQEDYRKKNLNVIRDLLEAFYLTLIDNYECIPESFKNNRGNPNHAWCARYFSGKPTRDNFDRNHTISFDIPDHISWSISYIKELSNGFSHISEDETLKNAFISTAFAMLTILEWLPEFIDENYL